MGSVDTAPLVLRCAPLHDGRRPRRSIGDGRVGVEGETFEVGKGGPPARRHNPPHHIRQCVQLVVSLILLDNTLSRRLPHLPRLPRLPRPAPAPAPPPGKRRGGLNGRRGAGGKVGNIALRSAWFLWLDDGFADGAV